MFVYILFANLFGMFSCNILWRFGQKQFTSFRVLKLVRSTSKTSFQIVFKNQSEILGQQSWLNIIIKTDKNKEQCFWYTWYVYISAVLVHMLVIICLIFWVTSANFFAVELFNMELIYFRNQKDSYKHC